MKDCERAEKGKYRKTQSPLVFSSVSPISISIYDFFSLEFISTSAGHTGEQKTEHFSKCYYKVQMKYSCSY